MANHPNRGWRSRWTVDLNTCTATHIDGWVFNFKLDEIIDGWHGSCIARPSPLPQDAAQSLARIAREAGDAYMEALNARH